MKKIDTFRSFGSVTEASGANTPFFVANMAHRLRRVQIYYQDEYNEFVEDANEILNSVRDEEGLSWAEVVSQIDGPTCDWGFFKTGMANRMPQEDSWNRLFKGAGHAREHEGPGTDRIRVAGRKHARVFLVDLTGAIAPILGNDPGRSMLAIVSELQYNDKEQRYEDKPVWAQYNDGAGCLRLAREITKLLPRYVDFFGDDDYDDDLD